MVFNPLLYPDQRNSPTPNPADLPPRERPLDSINPDWKIPNWSDWQLPSPSTWSLPSPSTWSLPSLPSWQPSTNPANLPPVERPLDSTSSWPFPTQIPLPIQLPPQDNVRNGRGLTYGSGLNGETIYTGWGTITKYYNIISNFVSPEVPKAQYLGYLIHENFPQYYDTYANAVGIAQQSCQVIESHVNLKTLGDKLDQARNGLQVLKWAGKAFSIVEPLAKFVEPFDRPLRVLGTATDITEAICKDVQNTTLTDFDRDTNFFTSNLYDDQANTALTRGYASIYIQLLQSHGWLYDSDKLTKEQQEGMDAAAMAKLRTYLPQFANVEDDLTSLYVQKSHEQAASFVDHNKEDLLNFAIDDINTDFITQQFSELVVIPDHPAIWTESRPGDFMLKNINQPDIAIAWFQADDSDNQFISYNIDGDDSHYFSIDSDTGLLSIRGVIDPAADNHDNHYTILVHAHSYGGTTPLNAPAAEITQLFILSMVDNWTDFFPTWAMTPTATLTVDESTDANVSLAQFQATPSSIYFNWGIQYSIDSGLGNHDKDYFAIDGNGQLSFISPPDYQSEHGAFYSISVFATCGPMGVYGLHENLVIRVQDIIGL